MYFFGREMISIFISEANEQVLSQAQQYLHLSVPFYFFLSQIFIYRNAVQGMGIAMIPMFSGIVELILRTSAAVYLTEYFGYSGIWLRQSDCLAGFVVISLCELSLFHQAAGGFI